MRVSRLLGGVAAAALVASVLLAHSAAAAGANPTFKVANGRFERDGKPFRIMAGSIHYSRVVPELWADRLQRLRAMGLNAVEVYVFWNWHQAQPGPADFSTPSRQLAKFLQLAKEAGLVVMLRVGPYGCGEWNGGGFPWWLHTLEPPVQIRTYQSTYISAVEQWWAQLLPYLKNSGSLYENGGSVIMVQIENEFGSFGDVAGNPLDKQYMEYLVKMARQHLGDNIVLYTTDGGSVGYMSRGSLNGSAVYTVGDFGPGSDPRSSFAAQDQFNPPPMRGAHLCSEFYSGWLTHWGEHMANTSSSGLAKAMDTLFSLNASLSLYMGHGGTNFGRFAGANGGGSSFEPHITSYDYDAPLSEGGGHGYGSSGEDKYAAVQEVLLRWARKDGSPLPPPEAPAPAVASLGTVVMTGAAAVLPIGGGNAPNTNVFQVLCANQTTTAAGAPPPAFHTLGVSDGIMLAITKRPGPVNASGGLLDIGRPNDRAQVFVDGAFAGTVWRPSAAPVTCPAPPGPYIKNTMSVLVEDMGRLNYGKEMFDMKGFGPLAVPGASQPVLTLNGKAYEFTEPWVVCGMTLDDGLPEKIEFKPVQVGSPTAPWSYIQPAFFRGVLATPASGPVDTYIATYGWSKGYIWLNGVLLGRYWETKGPQHTLYVPASLLLPAGQGNELVFLEMERPNVTLMVSTVAAPDFSFGVRCSVEAAPAAGSAAVTWGVESAAESNQVWSVPAQGATGPISLASDPSLCLQAGPEKDPSTGDPAAQLAACSAGEKAQQWTVAADGALLCEGSCLDITAHATAPGSAVETYACNGGDNQRWSAVTAAGGARIVSAMDGQALTACTAS
ncbi:hypothetical protein FNF28_07864 [Cafeteria roenbergensis]|uniref:Ricin B lectin domain-containing protein n=1 Tax=Cafeteria roenbergensis TaxID=33653 RepID=A0A5A8BY74_CAFRO|nr:hypothetical protein FNF28_07864 [Cafeteria roenbergensis]